MDTQTLYLGMALLSLVIINIILGSLTSIFQQQFDKATLWKGILKGLVVTACFVAVVYIGKLTPNIIVVNVNGVDVNLSTATYMLMLSSYIWYGKEVLLKLSGFVGNKFKMNDLVVAKDDVVEIVEDVKE